MATFEQLEQKVMELERKTAELERKLENNTLLQQDFGAKQEVRREVQFKAKVYNAAGVAVIN